MQVYESAGEGGIDTDDGRHTESQKGNAQSGCLASASHAPSDGNTSSKLLAEHIDCLAFLTSPSKGATACPKLFVDFNYHPVIDAEACEKVD